MNLKIQSDRLDGSGAVQNSPAAPGQRLDAHGPRGRSEDSVGISDLSTQIAQTLSAEDVRMESRIEKLAAMYAKGDYHPDAAAVSKSMVARALDSGESVKL